eukprot:TRINITY_DN779_c0_g1_i11.p1 TRINITY_DN779_c0_g1~~TRINITY_DN779_c0_g1_i11.p1  ORF type:complete len:229 (+),score=40.90 TRINITY_DN779_c0_g1_i11:228-914(+)
MHQTGRLRDFSTSATEKSHINLVKKHTRISSKNLKDALKINLRAVVRSMLIKDHDTAEKPKKQPTVLKEASEIREEVVEVLSGMVIDSEEYSFESDKARFNIIEHPQRNGGHKFTVKTGGYIEVLEDKTRIYGKVVKFVSKNKYHSPIPALVLFNRMIKSVVDCHAKNSDFPFTSFSVNEKIEAVLFHKVLKRIVFMDYPEYEPDRFYLLSEAEHEEDCDCFYLEIHH